MSKDSIEDVLKENIMQFLNSAEIIYKNQDYTSSSILYFKCYFSILDLLILKKTGRIPKDHSERFRLLESEFKELYAILDRLYPIYRNSYNAIILKEECDIIKENVEGIIKEQRILESD